MAERLAIVKLQPAVVLDWSGFLGASRGLLEQTYPRARVLAVEADEPSRATAEAQLAQPWWSPRRWVAPQPGVQLEADVPAGACQLLWSNMGLHLAADPQAVMAQWHRSITAEGFLMFSTLGPGSLQSLAGLYAERGWPAPFAPFVDMHDLGDMLVEAGFADPVMDQEQINLTWASPEALLAELRTLGGNVSLRRFAGLRTPRWRRRLADALGTMAGPDGRVSLVFELVYGHAFRPPPRLRLAPETAVPLADLRAMLRAARRDG